ncbi:MAG: MarR family transcriptional regulator [Chloroflexi bacterium]|nr:MarR family transcriptional regulator [Chloroflexota bacterium]
MIEQEPRGETAAGGAVDRPDRLTEEIGGLIHQLMRNLRGDQVQDWTTLDLTMAQLKIMFVLHCEGPSPISRLSAVLGVTMPSVTGTVDRLVRQGFVERQHDSDDRRVVIARLTEAGHALADRLHQGRRARLARALERLDPAEQEQVRAGLTVLLRASAEQ